MALRAIDVSGETTKLSSSASCLGSDYPIGGRGPPSSRKGEQSAARLLAFLQRMWKAGRMFPHCLERLRPVPAVGSGLLVVGSTLAEALFWLFG